MKDAVLGAGVVIGFILASIGGALLCYAHASYGRTADNMGAAMAKLFGIPMLVIGALLLGLCLREFLR